MDKEIVFVANYSNDSPLTLTELCEICHAPIEFVFDLISYEIIQPHGSHPSEWLFDLSQLRRTKTAVRLKHDLEVNMQGIAIILDLLDEITLLRSKAELYEKHYRRK